MLGFVLRGVEAPVEAGVIDAVAVPGLCDVDFAVGGPGEGFVGKEPERGPDPACAGEGEDCG